ncbi:MAG: DUF4469 domain-containing protein [Treponema sp.]|nr:DUF4469 domain-containing protein [Treponema sp.]
MNTNKIELINGSVNVTVHKNHFREDDSSYAKVKRNTAGMNNVIATILQRSSLVDKATLVATQMLFKDAVLELLQQGVSVNLFELGTLYPSAQGSIENENPSVEEIPALALGFTPSAEALEAVRKTDISVALQEETMPVINQIEDLATHKTDCTVTNGMPVRITGRRLKIAGDSEKTGLFFAPQQADGTIDTTESDWIRIDEHKFFKNTSTYLELILPDSFESGNHFSLVVRTAAGRGTKINKTIRSLVYEKTVTIA